MAHNNGVSRLWAHQNRSELAVEPTQWKSDRRQTCVLPPAEVRQAAIQQYGREIYRPAQIVPWWKQLQVSVPCSRHDSGMIVGRQRRDLDNMSLGELAQTHHTSKASVRWSRIDWASIDAEHAASIEEAPARL